MLYFSATNHAFYNDVFHASLPPDAVEITAEHHAALLSGQAVGKLLGADVNGLPILIDPPVHIPTETELCASVDRAADLARARVAADPLRAVEYDRAAAQAGEFKAAGYPADAVPRTVAAWAINGRTAQQAADSILAEAEAYTEALFYIREQRLAAKEQIRTLMTAGDVAQAQLVAEQTIAAIQAAVAGVGNAA